MNPDGPTTGFHHLEWHVNDGIGFIVLNRPPSNEMTSAFFGEMSTLVKSIRGLNSLRGIILTGSGRHFSSGAALPELLAKINSEDCTGTKTEAEGSFLLRNYRSLTFLEESEIPVIAAVRGVCLGSAFEMVLWCHFRICCDDAVFGLPESTFNLMPGLGGIRRIATLSGKANAIELTLRGRTFGAGEAMELGLVDLIVPKKKLAATAVSLIESVNPGYRKEKKTLYLKRYLHHVTFNDHAV